MNTENYINLTNNFNDLLQEKCEELYNQGIYFEYTTANYIDYIIFGGTCVFDSDNDTNINSYSELETLIKIRLFNIQKDIGFLINDKDED